MLEGPDLNRRKIEHTAGGVVEIVDLQAIVKDPYPAEVTVERCGLRSREPPGSESRDARNPVEQVDQRESAGREELGAVPVILWSDLVGEGIGKPSDGRLDGIDLHLGAVYFDARAISDRIRGRLRRDWHLTDRWRHHLSMDGRNARVQNRPGQKAEAGWAEPAPRALFQRALPRMNSMKVPVGTPVGPFGIVTRSVSE